MSRNLGVKNCVAHIDGGAVILGVSVHEIDAIEGKFRGCSTSKVAGMATREEL
jgi:hypothetical protein